MQDVDGKENMRNKQRDLAPGWPVQLSNTWTVSGYWKFRFNWELTEFPHVPDRARPIALCVLATCSAGR